MSTSSTKLISWPLQPHTLPAIYIGTLLVVALKATLGTKTQRAQLFGPGYNPSANGVDLLPPAAMRANNVCENIATLRPDLMDRKGFGDILQRYEAEGVVDPAQYDPALLEIITKSIADHLTSPTRKANLRMVEIAKIIDLTPTLDLRIKGSSFKRYDHDESDLNPVPTTTRAQAIAQEKILQSPKLAKQWVQLDRKARLTKVQQEANRLPSENSKAFNELWETTAKGLVAKLPTAKDLSPIDALAEACERTDDSIVNALRLRACNLLAAYKR